MYQDGAMFLHIFISQTDIRERRARKAQSGIQGRIQFELRELRGIGKVRSIDQYAERIVDSVIAQILGRKQNVVR